MIHGFRFRSFRIGLIAIIAMVACSDDNNPTDGGAPPDTAPPGIQNVTAVDASHVDVLFNEAVARGSAERASNYALIQSGPIPAERREQNAGGLGVYAAVLRSDGRTVTLSTDAMSATGYQLVVRRVEDTHGNAMSEEGIYKPFTGSADADITAPLVVYRSPAPGATGVAKGALIQITFSEPVQISTVVSGFSMNDGTEFLTVEPGTGDRTHYVIIHDLLDLNTHYQLALTGVLDLLGNQLADTEWSFRTTNVDDNIPPTVVSMSPANNTVNVNVDANLSITFSEPVNQVTLFTRFLPGFGGFTSTWSNGGKTVTYDPNELLYDDQQYTIVVQPGEMEDLAGNRGTALFTAVFSTGAALESGSIMGTIAGDPNSSSAGDPTGAIVLASISFVPQGEFYYSPTVTTVAENNTFTLAHLPDDGYYPICTLDTNGDGFINPFRGDAVGFYGIDSPADTEPDSVTISGGTNASGIDFSLFDPTAVYGTVHYEGQYASEFPKLYVGVFEAAGFDPATSQPIAGVIEDWAGGNTFFLINSFDESVGPIPDGNYYVGAFLDANGNQNFDPAIDPAGLYGGDPPTAIPLFDGSDAADLQITVFDPTTGASTASVHWPTQSHAEWLEKLSKAISEAQVVQHK